MSWPCTWDFIANCHHVCRDTHTHTHTHTLWPQVEHGFNILSCAFVIYNHMGFQRCCPLPFSLCLLCYDHHFLTPLSLSPLPSPSPSPSPSLPLPLPLPLSLSLSLSPSPSPPSPPLPLSLSPLSLSLYPPLPLPLSSSLEHQQFSQICIHFTHAIVHQIHFNPVSTAHDTKFNPKPTSTITPFQLFYPIMLTPLLPMSHSFHLSSL